MKIDIVVHMSDDENSLTNLIHHLTTKVNHIMTTLDDIVAKVAALTTVDDSVVALLTDLKTKLDAAINAGADPVKLQALSDAIELQAERLSQAVVQNTPAAP